MNILALDIGGSFIKSAYLRKNAKPVRSIVPFELWKQPQQLASTLRALRPKGRYECAITMTGELCDCFASRRQGVRHIVESAQEVFGSISVFGVRGELLSLRQAVQRHCEVASANWAIAPLLLAGDMRDFLLVDIGSTTTDMTPVRKGNIANKGWTDFGRLKNGELLYTGYLRTPVQAVAQAVRVGGACVPLSAETFCQMGDLYLLLKKIGSKKYNATTPDGKGKTVAAALRRLARCVLAEPGELSALELLGIAQQVAKAQQDAIVAAAVKFGLPLVTTGTGAFILDEVLNQPEGNDGKLARHELADRHGYGVDPSLALALLMERGF